MRVFRSFRVQEATQVGEVRRAALTLARELGFDDTTAARLGICATEVAGNLVKHVRGGGEVLLRAPDPRSIELLAIDSGPGMRDVGECLSDGYSTAGTPGTGLGALIRQSTAFDLYSVPGKGTIVYSRVACPDAAPDRGEMGALCLPVAGETVCGDDWSVKPWSDTSVWYAIADGLGHGPNAHAAADEAVRLFERQPREDLADYFNHAHKILRSTRGAAMSVASVDRGRGRVTFCGVGNVAGVLLSPGGASKSMVAMNGTLGYGMRRVQEFVYPIEPGSVLVMYSDGLSSHWDLSGHSGLLSRHPLMIAAVLYRDFRRVRDDVTVLVARLAGAAGERAA